MTLIITPDFVPDNHPIRTKLPMKPKYISIHETANRNRGADDIMHGKYLKGTASIDRTVSWHFTVDHDSIRQHLPTNEVGWHAGDGYNGTGNRESIAIEMCVNEDGDYFATLRLTAELVAHLVATEPSLLPYPECTTQHNKWSGKDCPHVLRSIPGGWQSFIGMCWNAMKPAVPTTLPSTVLVDGRVVECDAFLKDGRNYGHIPSVVAAMGGTFAWDGKTRTLSIRTPASGRNLPNGGHLV